LKPFDLIPIEFQKILKTLEEQDQRERNENLKRSLRLRQIPRVTGEFLIQFLLIHAPSFSEEFVGIEIGTSGGYSTLWQGLALHNLGYGQLVSLDNDPRNAEKEDYCDYYNKLVTGGLLVSGGVLVADNVISHAEDLEQFIRIMHKDTRVTSITIPVGKGLAVIRRL